MGASLNKSQTEAVNSRSEFILCIGVPGCGKSTTIVHRIARLAKEVNPATIYALTFTSNGARVLADRLASMQIKIGFVGTIHGLGLRLIQKHGHLIGYSKGKAVTIIQDEAREELLKTVKNRLGYAKLSAKATLAEETHAAKAVMAEYRATLKRNSMLDYDTLLKQAARLLLLGLKLDVTHLVVDETQDSGEDDWEIFDLLPGDKFYCADPDQAVFAFRGGRPDILLSRVPGATVIPLERNYRSAPMICHAANLLINHNANRIPKTINPDSSDPETIDVMALEASRNEAITIAGILKHHRTAGRIEFKEMAVLARTNAIVDEIRNTLREMNIPVAEPARRTLPPDWSLCITTLQLFLCPENDLLCEQYLRGINYPLVAMNRAKMKTLKDGHSLVFETIDTHPMFHTERPICDRLAMAEISPASVQIVNDRLKQLPAGSLLPDLLADLFDPEKWDDEPDQEGVTVSTIHKIKGAEADLVIVAAMEEGVLPSLSKSSDLSEERRLAFVAVTRARKVLIFTHCAKRFSYGRMLDQKPSRFLSEMGLDSTPFE